MDAFVNNLQLQGSAEVPSIESSPPVESQVTYTETLRVQDQFNEAVIHNSGVISTAISVTNEIIEDNAHPRNLTYYVPLSVTVEITPGVIMTQSVVARLETSTGVISDTLEVVKGLEQEAEDLKTSSQYTKTITHAQNQINILSARRNQIGISRNEKERINVQISVWQSAAKEAQKKLDYELYILNLAQDIAWEEAFTPYITDSNGQEIYLNGGNNNDSSEGASEVAVIDSETAHSIYTDEMTEDELIAAYLRHKGLPSGSSASSSEDTVLGSTSAVAMLFSAQGKEALLRSILVGSLLLSACGRGDTEVSIDTPSSTRPVAQEPDKGVAPAPTVVSVEIGGDVIGPDVTSTVPPQEFGTGGQAGAPVVTPDLQGPVVVEGDPIVTENPLFVQGAEVLDFNNYTGLAEYTKAEVAQYVSFKGVPIAMNRTLEGWKIVSSGYREDSTGKWLWQDLNTGGSEGFSVLSPDGTFVWDIENPTLSGAKTPEEIEKIWSSVVSPEERIALKEAVSTLSSVQEWLFWSSFARNGDIGLSRSLALQSEVTNITISTRYNPEISSVIDDEKVSYDLNGGNVVYGSRRTSFILNSTLYVFIEDAESAYIGNASGIARFLMDISGQDLVTGDSYDPPLRISVRGLTVAGPGVMIPLKSQ